MKKATAWLGLTMAAALTVSACSTKAENNSGGAADSDLKSDAGVTADTITLGVLTDTSGVFKATGLNITQGNQLWVDHINEEGGICDREISLMVKDHGYKPDNAISLYDQTKNEVAGYMQILGSAVIAAVKGKLATDKIMAAIATQSTMNLDVDEAIMVATGYDLQTINGLAWAMEQGVLAEGDTIAHIYVDSEYGLNALMGSKYFAEQHGMTVMPIGISASDTDMTATMTKIKAAGANVLALTTTPAGTASVALQNQIQGMNLPMIGNSPVFADSLLDNPQVVSALQQLHIFNGSEPFAGASEMSKTIQDWYAEKYPDAAPGYGVISGYLEALAWQAILEKACEDGDMTRQGLLDARLSLTEVDSMGLSEDMDLSDPGQPPVRSVYIYSIDPSTPGGEKLMDGPYISDDAKEYKTPYQGK